MKSILTSLILCTSLLSFAQETTSIKWMTWNEMVEQREKDSVKKKVFIDLYTEWCGWCKKMDASTFMEPSVVNYMNNNYYPVKFDAETTDTIVFNNHQFTNSDPTYVKPSPRSRGRVHWFAHSLLEGKTSYPSYVILDEHFTRLMIWKGYKNQEDMIGILVFFAKEQYKYYHNFLNEQWQKSLKQQQQNQQGGK